MSNIVLNFHGLGDPHDSVAADERPYWLSFDQFDRLLDRIWTQHDPARFLFTFDDGNISDLAAAERLAQRGVSARFFVLTGRFDDPHYLARDDLGALVQAGMIVGLHGRHHLDWRKLDQAAFDDETATARRELSEVLGARVGEVAIPFGAYNRRVMRALAGQGFARIHTTDRGILRSQSDRIWNRTTLRGDMDDAAIERVLSGSASLAERARRATSVLVRRHLR